VLQFFALGERIELSKQKLPLERLGLANGEFSEGPSSDELR